MAESEHLNTEWENQPLESENLEEDDDIEVDTGSEPEARLSRFLYLGKEYTNYQPGYWFVHNYFVMNNVPSIEELASNEETKLIPIDLITKVSTDTNCIILVINCFSSENIYRHLRAILFRIQRFWRLHLPFAASKAKVRNYVTQLTKV